MADQDDVAKKLNDIAPYAIRWAHVGRGEYRAVFPTGQVVRVRLGINRRWCVQIDEAIVADKATAKVAKLTAEFIIMFQRAPHDP